MSSLHRVSRALLQKLPPTRTRDEKSSFLPIFSLWTKLTAAARLNMNRLLDTIGHTLAGVLSKERHAHGATPPTPSDQLLACLEPADVLLVEGNSNISTAIKYLTQSTWSHAALYVGQHGLGHFADSAHCFVEADLVEGVRSVGIAAFAGMPTRICRPG